MIHAILYDLDDTMVDSDPLHSRAWEEVLRERNLNFSALPEDLRASFVGRRVIDIATSLVDYLQISEQIPGEFYQRRIEAFLSIAERELRPMPGLIESLERFQSAGYRLAIASSGTSRYIELVVKKFQLAKFFDAIVTGDDVKLGKPHPETYLIAAQRVGVAPSECVVFEDATIGIRSATAAGCLCVAIRNPKTPTQDYREATLIVDSLDQISVNALQALKRE